MFFPNFLTLTLETPTLSRHRRHGRKRRLQNNIFLPIMFKKKTNFSFTKRVHRTYVTVANQSTVHRTNPSRKKIQYQRTATQTETLWLYLRVTNHSERTLLLGDSHIHCISQTFLLDRKTQLVGIDLFLQPDSGKHLTRCL